MCLTLDTGEAEQTRIVKSTCGEQWGGEEIWSVGGGPVFNLPYFIVQGKLTGVPQKSCNLPLFIWGCVCVCGDCKEMAPPILLPKVVTGAVMNGFERTRLWISVGK